MTIKEKFNSIDQSKLNADQKGFLEKIKNVTKDFTVENKEVNDKVEGALDKMISTFKEKMPEVIKTAEKKEPTKKEPTKKVPAEKKEKTSTGKRTVMSLAKEIRKEGESWKDAQARARKQMKEDSESATKTMKTELQKLQDYIKEHKELKDMGNTNLLRDASRQALPSGRRVSHKGWKNQYGTSDGGKVYYERRENRRDRLAPNYPQGAPKLANGGDVDAFTLRMVKGNAGNPDEVRKEQREIAFANGGMMDNMSVHDGTNFMNIPVYKRGGGVHYRPYGKTKGRFILKYKIDGEQQTEIWTSLEEAVANAKRYSSPKLGYTNIEIYDNSGEKIKFADGGDFMSGAYANDGMMIGKNTDVILTSNSENKLTWRGIVTPNVLKDIEEFQYQGGHKRYEIDIYDENLSEKPNKENINKLNGFLNKIGIIFGTVYVYREDYADGGDFMSGAYAEEGAEVKYIRNKDGIRVKSVAMPEKELTEAEWLAKHNESREARTYAVGGDINAKELNLGYKYSYERDEDNLGSLSKEHGVYFVRGFEDGKHFSESFENFADAKKFYLLKKNKYAVGGGIFADTFTGTTGTHYTGLVGETNAMSSGEMFADGGGIGENYKIIFSKIYENGKVSDTAYSMIINSNSEKEAVMKFKNQYPSRKIESINKEYADGGFMNGVYAESGAMIQNQQLIADAHLRPAEMFGREGIPAYKRGGMLTPSQRYVLELKGLTGLTQSAIEDYISENKLTNDEVLNIVIGLGRKQLDKSDVATAMVGKKDNAESKKLLAFAKSKKALSYSEGGGIPNNYEGKTPEQVWGMLTTSQKYHFLLDHNKEIESTPRSIEDNTKKSYKFLPTKVKVSFKKHIETGEYANGGGVSLKGNQSKIDMNKNGKIDAEDFKMLRSSMNGASRNERKHINKDQNYEVRYARKHNSSRTGYKRKSKLNKGGAFEKLSNQVAKEYEGDAVAPKYQRMYGKKYSKEEAKEVGDKVAGKVKAMQMTNKKAFGGLFGKSAIVSTPKVSLDDKQVMLKNGEWVQVLDHSGNTLMVMDLGKLGTGAVPKRVNISEVDMTSFMAGGKVEPKTSKPKTSKAKSTNPTKRGGAMQLAKEIRKEGEKWTDAVKRANAQLKK